MRYSTGNTSLPESIANEISSRTFLEAAEDGDRIKIMRGILARAASMARSHSWPGAMSRVSSQALTPAALRSAAKRVTNNESLRLYEKKACGSPSLIRGVSVLLVYARY